MATSPTAPQVKVEKIAVWKIGGLYYEDSKSAASAARAEILRSLLSETAALNDTDDLDEVVDNLIHSWDLIESSVEKAMAGT